MNANQRHRGWQQYVILLTLLSMVAVVAFVAVWAAGTITKDQATGAEPSSVYHDALSKGFPLQGDISWQPPAGRLERKPTDATLDRVEQDWAAIWFTIDGMRSNQPVANPELLLDQSVIDRLELHQPSISRQTVQQMSHELQVTFYSIDGAVMGIRVTEALARHDFEDSVNGYPLTMVQSSHYSAVIVLTDGRWRLVGLERTATGEPLQHDSTE